MVDLLQVTQSLCEVLIVRREHTHTLTHCCFPPQALPYVCLLIAMLFFIYAIIGMQVSPAAAAAKYRLAVR